MRYCIECGASFAVVREDQKFCSTPCRERFKKRRQRLKRQDAGLCPQCGALMVDRPLRRQAGRAGATAAAKISYCAACRAKFRLRHEAARKSEAATANESANELPITQPTRPVVGGVDRP